jgi:HNH endonuclease
MAISQSVRDRLLVEAKHRCTICAEKCFEIHHIIEQSEGGSDDPENLIVLCPNCHQHRYHRSGEISRAQIRLYKEKLSDKNEVERRLLLNLEEIKSQIGEVSFEESERRLRHELNEAAQLVSPDDSPEVHSALLSTSHWLAEHDLIKGGARRAIEIRWDVERRRLKAQFPEISVLEVDHDGWQKAAEFERAYTLVFRLNRRPHHDWAQAFMHFYHQALYLMKRRTSIQGDRIVMVVADSDNLQGHADFAKQLVEETNQHFQQRVFQKIDGQVEGEKRRELDEFDTLRTLKQKTKDIRI